MKIYPLEFHLHGPFYRYDDDIKRVEKIIGTSLKSEWNRVFRFKLEDCDADALIVLKFTCEDIIYSLKELEKIDTGIGEDEYLVVNYIC